MFYRTNSPQTEVIQFKLHDIINNITDYIMCNKRWQIQEQQREKKNQTKPSDAGYKHINPHRLIC